MINDQNFAQEQTTKFCQRILKHCDLTEPLNKRTTLLRQESQLEEKITEYTQQRKALNNKFEALNSQIGEFIANCKSPETISKERRQIKLQIEDIDTWIDESETLLLTVQENIKASTELIHKALHIASTEEKQIVTDELNEDLKRIEDKIEAWNVACSQLSATYNIHGLNHALYLSNREVKYHISA